MTTVDSTEDRAAMPTTVQKLAHSDILTVLNRTAFPIVVTVLLGIIGFEAERAISKIDLHSDRLTSIETKMDNNKSSIDAIPDIEKSVVKLATSIDDTSKMSENRRTARDAEVSGLQVWIKAIAAKLETVFPMIADLDKRLSVDEARKPADATVR
jgi:hypothetical protein